MPINANPIEDRPLRLAYIGVGGIAAQHLRTLEKVREAVGGVDFVCGADINPKALALAKENHALKHAYEGPDAWRDMLEKHAGELDACVVCTPNDLHSEMTVGCLEAGLHTMVEKPMARTVAEGEAMLAAATEAKRELVIGFQWRYHAESRYIKRQVDDGVLGDIVYTRVQALRRRGIPNWGTFGDKSKNGGGPMIDMGVHLLELAVYLMGTHIPKPVAVSGQTWTYLGDKPDETENMWPNWDHTVYTVEDLAVGHVRFANGSSLVIESSYAAHIPDETNDVQLMGTKGGAVWSKGEVYTDRNGFMQNLKPAYLRKTDIWQEKLKHFIGVARGERENISSGAEGLAVQKILNGVYRAAEAGREVTFE